MTQEEALELVRALLKAPDEEALTRQIAQNLPRADGTFFAVLNSSVEQLQRERKPEIAAALDRLGGMILKMKTLI